jgi:hydroxymethylglutaryl-CoA lyase
MCFGDPWEGNVPIPQVIDVGRRLLSLDCHELSIGDTIGAGTPGHVVALIDAFEAAGVPKELLAAHFHDTYGQALANTYAAMQRGITTIDTSAGGLGGCPFARSAPALATEDLVWQLHGLRVDTGIDLGVGGDGRMARPSPRPARPSRRPCDRRTASRLSLSVSSGVPSRRRTGVGTRVAAAPRRARRLRRKCVDGYEIAGFSSASSSDCVRRARCL